MLVLIHLSLPLLILPAQALLPGQRCLGEGLGTAPLLQEALIMAAGAAASAEWMDQLPEMLCTYS